MRLLYALMAFLLALTSFAFVAPTAHAVPTPLVIHGVLNRQKIPTDPTVAGFVLSDSWAHMQPVANGALNTSVIDNGIAAARARGIRVKLRIDSGALAPAWVKALSGGPVTIRDISQSTTGSTFTIPRFWTWPAQQAYDQLQYKLSLKYDGNPTVGQVTLNGPMMQFHEPYLRDCKDTFNRTALLNAGFTVAQDKAALHRNMMDGGYWHTTPLEITFNPYQVVDASGVHPDLAFTVAEMKTFRSMYGQRAVLANYSISSSRVTDPLYAYQKALGKPLAYQTATAAKIGNWVTTLNFAVSQGASSVELPVGYLSWDQRLLDSYNAKLEAN